MGHAAYARGSAAIRRQADEDVAAARIRADRKGEPLNWQDNRKDLVARIAELEHDRKRAVRCIRAMEASRTFERLGVQEEMQSLRDRLKEATRLWLRAESGRRWLSGLARHFISPADVQGYRDYGTAYN